METPSDYKSLTLPEKKMLIRSQSLTAAMLLDLGSISLASGAGVLTNGKCVWTKGGKRITFTMESGAFVAAISKEDDPLADPANRGEV